MKRIGILLLVLLVVMAAMIIFTQVIYPELVDHKDISNIGSIQISTAVVGEPGEIIPLGIARSEGAVGISSKDIIDLNTGEFPQCCSVRPGSATLTEQTAIQLEIRPNAQPGVYSLQATFVLWDQKEGVDYVEWGEQHPITLRWTVRVK